jgi:phosphatidate phosphatase PAH1
MNYMKNLVITQWAKGILIFDLVGFKCLEEEINLEEILASLEEEMNYSEDEDDQMEKDLDEEINFTLEEDEEEELEEEINLDTLMEELMEEEVDYVIKAAEMLGTSTDAIEAMASILTSLGIVGIAGGKDLAKSLVDKGAKEG